MTFVADYECVRSTRSQFKAGKGLFLQKGFYVDREAAAVPECNSNIGLAFSNLTFYRSLSLVLYMAIK